MNAFQVKHKNSSRFLKLILLTSLKEENLYGYGLLDKLNESGRGADMAPINNFRIFLNIFISFHHLLSFSYSVIFKVVFLDSDGCLDQILV